MQLGGIQGTNQILQMMYQLVPPHNHHCNTAEKAIQIFKDHFIAILCGTDTSFPLYLWCRLLPQAEHTLNMLWKSCTTPTISAYAYLWGQHNYNTNPFAPLGCKVQAHVTPTICKTWAVWGCLTAVCKALSLANAKGKGTDGLVIRS